MPADYPGLGRELLLRGLQEGRTVGVVGGHGQAPLDGPGHTSLGLGQAHLTGHCHAHPSHGLR